MDGEPARQGTGRGADLRRLAAGGIAILLLVGVLAWRWPDLRPVFAGADVTRLLLLWPVAFVLTLVTPVGWHLILRSLGTARPLRTTAGIWLSAAASRFIPGAIWPYAARIALSRDIGVPVRVAGASLFVETLLAATTSLVVGLPALAMPWPRWGIALGAAAAVGLALLLLHPGALRALQRLPGLRDPVEDLVASPVRRDLLWLALWYAGYWVAWGALFHFYVGAFVPDGPGAFWMLLSTYALAYCAGYVLPLLPAGIGIREGALFLLLSLQMPADPALAIAITLRFWMLCAELPALFTGLWLGRAGGGVRGGTLP